ncbi:MAG: hypothetical protein Kow00107_09730 [Planctomycetota bacterium]
MSLVTPHNTTIPFTFAGGATRASQPSYGVYITCNVAANGFTLTDKWGN